MKQIYTLIFVLLLLTACVPKPEPYVLEEREPAPDISEEIRQIEDQAREQAREKLAAEEKQEQQKSGIALGLYPQYFMDGADFKSNFITVVGEEAPSIYVVAVANLVARTPGNKPTGFSMLAGEISDLSRHNAIIAGNACNNDVAAKLLGNPSPCDSAQLPAGKGLIRLYESANGNVAILATGRTDALVVNAVNAIGTDAFIGAAGSEICVQGTSLVQC